MTGVGRLKEENVTTYRMMTLVLCVTRRQKL